MWDWTGAKKPPPYKIRETSETEMLDEGVTPSCPPSFGYHRDPRIIPYEKEKTDEANRSKMYSKPPEVPVHPSLLPHDANSPWGQARGTFGADIYQPVPQQEQNFEASLKTTTAVMQDAAMDTDFLTPKVVEVSDEMGIWEWQFSMFNLPNMVLKEVDFAPLAVNKKNELRRGFKRARRDFLRYIAYYNVSELQDAGIDEKGLRILKKGKVPENCDVHLKVPFEYGGTNDFSNLIFIQTHPFHEDIHKFIDMQTTSQPLGCRLSKLYIPVADGRVYVPNDSSALGGGKGKGDKTSVQGYSASALQALAMKTIDRGANI